MNAAEMLGKRTTSDQGPEAEKEEIPAKAKIGAAEYVNTTPVGAVVFGAAVPVSEEELNETSVGASVVSAAVPVAEERPVGAVVLGSAVPVVEEGPVGAVILSAAVPVEESVQKAPVGAMFVAAASALTGDELAAYLKAKVLGEVVDVTKLEAVVKAEQRFVDVSVKELMIGQRFLQESRGTQPVKDEENPVGDKGSAAGSSASGEKTVKVWATVTGRVYEVAENHAAVSEVSVVFKKRSPGKEHAARGPPAVKIGEQYVVVNENEETVRVTLLEGVLNLKGHVEEGVVLQTRQKLAEAIEAISLNEGAELSTKKAEDRPFVAEIAGLDVRTLKVSEELRNGLTMWSYRMDQTTGTRIYSGEDAKRFLANTSVFEHEVQVVVPEGAVVVVRSPRWPSYEFGSAGVVLIKAGSMVDVSVTRGHVIVIESGKTSWLKGIRQRRFGSCSPERIKPNGM